MLSPEENALAIRRRGRVDYRRLRSERVQNRTRPWQRVGA